METAFHRIGSLSRTNTQINIGNTSDSIITGNTGLEIVQRGFGEIGSETVKASESVQKLTETLNNLKLDSYQIELNDIGSKLNELLTIMSSSADGQTYGTVYQQLDQSATQAVLIHEKLNQIKDTFKNGLGAGAEESVRQADTYIKSIIEALQQIAPMAESTKQKLLDFAGVNEKIVTEALARTNQAMSDALNSEIDYVDERTKTTEQVVKFNEQLTDIRTSVDETIDKMLEDIAQRASSVENIGETMQTLTDMLSKYASTSLYSEINSLTDEIKDAVTESSQEGTSTFSNRYQDILVKIVSSQKASEEGNVEFYKTTTNMVKTLQESLSNVVQQQVNAINREIESESSDTDALEQKKQELVDLADRMKVTSETKLNELLTLQKDKIQQAITINQARQNDVTNFGSAENILARQQIATQNLAGLNYGALAGGGSIDDALAQLEYSNGMNSPWYQYVRTGNLLGDKTQLATNMRTTQMHGYVANSVIPSTLQALQNQKLSPEERAMMIGKLASANTSLNESVLQTGKDMNLRFGGAKNLNNADKQVYSAFQSQINVALQNLTRTIRAIEELDPSNSTLAQLKKEQDELIKLKQTADKAKDSSSAIADVFGIISSGASKLKNLLAGGLGILGLGALLHPMQMLGKAMDYENEEGVRRYNVARADMYMGASLNQDRIMDIARTQPNEYWRMTNGMISDSDYTDYYSDLAHNVGGHYGSTPEFAAIDMSTLADKTYAVSKQFDLSSSTRTDAMKTFYKDMRMSATEASQVLVDLAQTATSANIPVEKYIKTVTGMVNSLRNQGVHGDQVRASMDALVARNIRIEDAQSLVESQSRANENMAKDINASAFFGMMAGEEGSPIDIINAGYHSWDSHGNPKEDSYQRLAKRVIQEVSLMSNIGGGMGSSLGQMNAMDTLMSRGYDRQSASMAVDDAVNNGNVGTLAALLKDADEKKENPQKGLDEAVVEAKENLKKAGEQVSIFQKLSTDLAEAQKHIGQAINEYLSEPLAKFREGFQNALTVIVDLATGFAKSLHEFIDGGGLSSNSTLGKAADWVADNPLETLLGTAVVLGAGRYGLGKAGGFLKNAIVSRAPSAISTIANVGRVGAVGGTIGGLALAAGAIGGGAIGIAHLVKMFSDGTATVTAKTDSGEALHKAQYASSELNNMNTSHLDEDVNVTDEYLSGQDIGLQYEDPEIYQKYLNDAELAKSSIKGYHDVSAENYEANQENPNEDRIGAGMFAGGGLLTTLSELKNGGLSGIKDGFNALKSVGSTKDLWNLMKTGATGIGKKIPIIGTALTLGTNALDEYNVEQQHPDRFSIGEHLARFGIKSGLSLGGSAIGGLAGSLLGPVGAAAGITAGGLLGDYVGNKVVNSSVGDFLGISDASGKKNENEKYLSRIKQSESIYGDATKSIVSSNDDKTKAVGKALEEHGLKLEHLTNEQEKNLNDLFNNLQSLGIKDQLLAATMAGNIVGNQAVETKKDAEYAFDNDNILTGQVMIDLGKAVFGGKDPNAQDMQNHSYGALEYIGGAALKGTLDSDDLNTWKDAMTVGDDKAKLYATSSYIWDKAGSDFQDSVKHVNKELGHWIANTSGGAERQNLIAQAAGYYAEHQDDPNYAKFKNGLGYAAKMNGEGDIKPGIANVLSTQTSAQLDEKAQEVVKEKYGEKFIETYGEQPTVNTNDTSSTSSGDPDNPVDMTKKAIENSQSMLGQMGEFAKLSNKELLRDNIATGQLILDGTTAMGVNGRYLSLRGARDNFRANSGVHDNDLYGVGVHGAFSGLGKMLTNTGSMDLDNEMRAKLKLDAGYRGATRQYGSDFGNVEKYSQAIDEISDRYAQNKKQQVEIYEKHKENQEKSLQNMERNLDSATINFYGVQQSGSDANTNKRLARIENKQNNMEERMEYVGETLSQLSQVI